MISSLKVRIKNSNSPLAKLITSSGLFIRYFTFPTIKPFHGGLYWLHKSVTGLTGYLLRTFYWTPLFKSQLINDPKYLYLFSGMPLLLGNFQISMGDHCRVSGHTTFCGRSSPSPATLVIGNNVSINWQNEILVGNRIIIGNNVRLAVKVRLVGYPGHPVDPVDRANGLQDTPDQVGDIILEDNVWLGAGVSVMGGVTIGAGTIVATGSVVTKDLPPGVLAGGIPAKIIKKLPTGSEASHD
ncbi:acyltransferase [uncultured Endozoicomonas sp.]|uniref:acyltransferase n=1 Tax=uncultured Endozoicomonas sp. TaxID=432652 RepID=UPI00261CAC55|nr:acyltransferase [uncultured Endozoicomonas sp.]